MPQPVPKPEFSNKEGNVERWTRERGKLTKIFEEKGITYCEVCGVIGKKDKCWRSSRLSFHHKHKRRYYDAHPELLGDFNHVVLACPVGHEAIEYDRELNRKVFEELRNNG